LKEEKLEGREGKQRRVGGGKSNTGMEFRRMKLTQGATRVHIVPMPEKQVRRNEVARKGQENKKRGT